ncbi:MAG TPA: prepilin-type N-terminal cleavage/methylation domain-containing protein [Candidatus Dormibacteraeota bacterium]|nr:prepilin-type N-terminal cleavage/methylation domain-containing protein [Candidatus Dormibacteraeota bacterium]
MYQTRTRDFVPGRRGRARGKGRSAGFTLIETLVAFWILAIVIFSLYAALWFGFTTVRLSQENVRADQILMQKMETLRVYHWSAVFNPGFIPNSFQAPFAQANGTNVGLTYDGTINITDFPVSAVNESYADSLRQVTVTLNWVSGGSPHARSITSFVSKYGIQTYRY